LNGYEEKMNKKIIFSSLKKITGRPIKFRIRLPKQGEPWFDITVNNWMWSIKLEFCYGKKFKSGKLLLISLLDVDGKQTFPLFLNRNPIREKIPFRIRFPKKDEPWFDITIINRMLNIGLI
jgi:hypothetical protein